MRSRRIEGDDDSNWLLTFTDMITFLMAFFVIMYATQIFAPDKSEEMTGSIRATMGRDLQSQVLEKNEEHEVLSELQGYISESGLGNLLKITQTKMGIELTATGELAFASASDRLTKEGVELIKQVAEKLSEKQYKVAVEGHTDDVPINSDRFPSNWELSTARATTVVKEFIRLGFAPDRLAASGYADTRPVVDVFDATEKSVARAKNRRVVLVITR
ncbi:MAG: hypothetical protein D6B27_11045 [Gammaproteobacteria bacterium]|nr:MAG: hypothetical protein D6B27_11045 [Gammaproteobacteria bacterium]